jgi:hypothetical protein
MPAQGTYDARLLARARSGSLTRSNTTKGTPERRAVDRVTYLRRRDARPGVSAREALGGRVKRPQVTGITDDQRGRIAAGIADPADTRAFTAFRDSPGFPSWIPKDRAVVDDQTAAILAGLPKALDNKDVLGRRNGWKNVELENLPNGLVVVTVTPLRGRPFTFTLPDDDSAKQLLGIIRTANYPGLSVDVNNWQSGPVMTPASEPSAPPKKAAKKKPRKKPTK